LKPLDLTANPLAKAIGVPLNWITAILQDEGGITGDAAIRLGTFFKTSAEFWMNLQMTYDLRNAEKALPARVKRVSKTTGACWHDTQNRRRQKLNRFNRQLRNVGRLDEEGELVARVFTTNRKKDLILAVSAMQTMNRELRSLSLSD
jgi:addiction module HigA family antidote